jgi:hypothetical protein
MGGWASTPVKNPVRKLSRKLPRGFAGATNYLCLVLEVQAPAEASQPHLIALSCHTVGCTDLQRRSMSGADSCVSLGGTVALRRHNPRAKACEMYTTKPRVIDIPCPIGSIYTNGEVQAAPWCSKPWENYSIEESELERVLRILPCPRASLSKGKRKRSQEEYQKRLMRNLEAAIRQAFLALKSSSDGSRLWDTSVVATKTLTSSAPFAYRVLSVMGGSRDWWECFSLTPSPSKLPVSQFDYKEDPNLWKSYRQTKLETVLRNTYIEPHTMLASYLFHEETV